eukprot:9488450-Pyramimonas_sp.AAC.3
MEYKGQHKLLADTNMMYVATTRLSTPSEYLTPCERHVSILCNSIYSSKATPSLLATLHIVHSNAADLACSTLCDQHTADVPDDLIYTLPNLTCTLQQKLYDKKRGLPSSI